MKPGGYNHILRLGSLAIGPRLRGFACCALCANRKAYFFNAGLTRTKTLLKNSTFLYSILFFSTLFYSFLLRPWPAVRFAVASHKSDCASRGGCLFDCALERAVLPNLVRQNSIFTNVLRRDACVSENSISTNVLEQAWIKPVRLNVYQCFRSDQG